MNSSFRPFTNCGTVIEGCGGAASNLSDGNAAVSSVDGRSAIRTLESDKAQERRRACGIRYEGCCCHLRNFLLNTQWETSRWDVLPLFYQPPFCAYFVQCNIDDDDKYGFKVSIVSIQLIETSFWSRLLRQFRGLVL
jgi:hypothetical protein